MQARGLVLLVDPEGEGLNLRKALHSQSRAHRWLELRLDSPDVVDDALGAAAADSLVALEVLDMAVSQPLIRLLARRAKHLPPQPCPGSSCTHGAHPTIPCYS